MPEPRMTEANSSVSAQRALRLLTRRGFLAGLCMGVLTSGVLLWQAPASAQSAPDDVSVEKLMEKGPLEDLSIGSDDADVTIVEYASMTCGHCGNFHNDVFPALKEKYVDTGKVRFVFREFPLDNLALAVSMLGRCAGDTDKAFALVKAFFKRQRHWVVRGDPTPRLFEIAKQAGFTQESFDACLADEALAKKILEERAIASQDFGVSATPTFFINGKRLKGRTDQIEAFDKALEPLLKNS